MFFEFDENGKILSCSTEQLNSRMKQLKLPEGFNAEDIAGYIVKGAEIVKNAEYKRPTIYTMEDRLKKIEEAIIFLKKLWGLSE